MSPGTGLVDEQARDRIATDLASRLAVDAAAGSGKTTTLVNRIISLVSEAGLPMASIAAITFTEAAAAELRARIRRTLTQRQGDNPLLIAAAREVDDAAISTIHAFALRILSENWLEAGLAPNLEVLDAASEHLDHKTRWQRFTEELLADPKAGPTLMRGFAAGLRLSQLTDVAQALADHYDRLTEEVLAALDAERRRLADPVIDVAPVVAHLREARVHRLGCLDDSDQLCEHLDTVVNDAIGRLEPLIGSPDETNALSVLRDLPKLYRSNIGQKPNWGDAIGKIRDACEKAETARTRILEAAQQSVVTELGWRIALWAIEGAGERRREGRFSFHDLLVEACRVLRHNQDVLARVRNRYRCLLIDEFQDTDPLQAELSRLLGAPEQGEDNPVARLFVVGDPEQSIYRFRRADIAQFEATVSGMDDRVSLSSNFRSRPEILRFVDIVFERLGPEASAEGAVVHRPLSPTRSDPGGASGPVVAVFGGPDGVGRARDVRLRSTSDTASVIRSIVGESWSVEDQGAPRSAKFADVAVLLPTRTALPMLERSFDAADVPYRLEGATLVWASQDVRDVLAIARAVSDPANAVSVVAALRTPALACGDDDLVRFHERRGSWDPRSVVDAVVGDDPVERAMVVLAGLHTRRMWMDASSMISAIVEELRFFELALVHRRPRDHWQRLRWLLDQARAFDEANRGTLDQFLEWVDLSQEADRWSTSLGPPELDDDAVRVMTVHGAKGLEFPVVLLTGLDSPPLSTPPPVLFDERGVPRFSFSVEFRSIGFDRAAKADKEQDQAERLRLLYVALTRARDHLVVDLHHKEAAGQAFSAKLHPICESAPSGLVRLQPETSSAVTPAAAAPEAQLRDWWAEQRQWLAERKRLVQANSRQPALSATALAAASALGSEPSSGGRLPLDANHSQPAPDAQRRIGRAVHDALAKIELPADGVMSERAIRITAAAATAQGLDGPHSDLVEVLVGAALDSPLVRSLAAGRHWKELPLAAPLPPSTRGVAPVVEGFADLVGESAEGLVVVDFKTAQRSGSSQQYLGQVAAYAYALRRVTRQIVASVAVCYLGPDGADVEMLEGTALEAMVNRVVGVASATEPGSADVADSGQLLLFDLA